MTSGADVVGSTWPTREPIGTGMVDISIGIGILAVAYGVIVIVTAWGPRLKPDAIGYAIVATPIAKLWYGLAFVVPIAVTWGEAFLFNPRSLANSPYWDVVYFSGPASLAACILLARVSSVRPLSERSSPVARRATRCRRTTGGGGMAARGCMWTPPRRRLLSAHLTTTIGGLDGPGLRCLHAGATPDGEWRVRRGPGRPVLPLLAHFRR